MREPLLAASRSYALPASPPQLLRAIVAVRLRIDMRKVRLRALDKAYRLAFPKNKPFNIHKKRCHAE